jgi:hypothetical protein
MTMTNAHDRRVLADATEVVLDRLDAWEAGDERRVAEIDAQVSRNPTMIEALWSAAFGIAGHTLNVLKESDPSEAERTLRSYREQVAEYRAG